MREGEGEVRGEGTSLEGALVKVLDIFAGYWPVDLRDDIPVTHPHLEHQHNSRNLPSLCDG